MGYDPEPRVIPIIPHVGLGDILPVIVADQHYDLIVVGIDANDVVLARTDYGHVMPIHGATYRPPTVACDAYGTPVGTPPLVKIPRQPRNHVHASKMSPGYSDGRFGELATR